MYKDTLRQVWAEIDMSAFDHNVKEIKRQMQCPKMIGVIKANGYGHGATECAKVLKYNGVENYAVATLEEAINLREDGIEGNIVVLGLTPKECVDTVIEYDLIPGVMHYDYVKALSDEVMAEGAEPARVLFGLDTGMGRIGFRVFTDEERDYAVEQYKKFSELPGITIAGVITHFSTADEEQREYTGMQIANYKAFMEKLNAAGFNPKKICANSASIMVYPEIHFDACRPGIILYGLYPSDEVDRSKFEIRPVMSVKANIVHLKKVPAGTSISYGRKWTAEKDSIIATIPLGYADGYPRPYSSKAQVIVNGVKAPITGNICMDQCMIDVTHVPYVRIGDEVTIMGKDGIYEISADDIAEATGTINYEIACAFGQRLPKVYVY